MATYTSHYNLKKPATSDKIRIADFNGNADTIDSTMYDNASLIANLKSDIGIVENSNTASHNISAGQYVIWKGVLYTASSAISSGATLSSANLTAVSGGGLNSLSDHIGNHYIKSFTLANVAITDGSAQSPSFISLDLSSYVPSGYSIYNAIVSVKSGSNWYNLPNFSNSADKYLLLERVGNTSLMLKNTDTGWGTTNVTISIFARP